MTYLLVDIYITRAHNLPALYFLLIKKFRPFLRLRLVGMKNIKAYAFS